MRWQLLCISLYLGYGQKIVYCCEPGFWVLKINIIAVILAFWMLVKYSQRFFSDFFRVLSFFYSVYRLNCNVRHSYFLFQNFVIESFKITFVDSAQKLQQKKCCKQLFFPFSKIITVFSAVIFAVIFYSRVMNISWCSKKLRVF